MLDHHVGEDAASHVPLGRKACKAWIYRIHDVVEYLIRYRFMKHALVSKVPDIQLQALEFHAPLVGNVIQIQTRKIRLTRERAQAGKFWNLNMYLKISAGMRIGKTLQLRLRLTCDSGFAFSGGRRARRHSIGTGLQAREKGSLEGCDTRGKRYYKHPRNRPDSGDCFPLRVWFS